MWSEYKINEKIIIKSMYSLFEAEYKDGFSFPGESHNFWECLYVENGSVCISADEKIYNLSENELIVHKPMELHKFYVKDPVGAKLFIFSFSADGEILDFFKNKVFRLLDEQKSIISDMLEFIHSKIRGYDIPENIPIEEKYLYPFEKSPLYPQTVSTYICRLFLSLCDENCISAVSDSPDAVIFRKAVNFMNNSFALQPSLSEIAMHCNVSETSLKRIFYKYSDLGVHKYFVKLRIKTAASLLKDGYSVTEISEKLGFGSQGYFSAVFKRETGLSPSEFKSNPDYVWNFI